MRGDTENRTSLSFGQTAAIRDMAKHLFTTIPSEDVLDEQLFDFAFAFSGFFLIGIVSREIGRERYERLSQQEKDEIFAKLDALIKTSHRKIVGSVVGDWEKGADVERN